MSKFDWTKITDEHDFDDILGKQTAANEMSDTTVYSWVYDRMQPMNFAVGACGNIIHPVSNEKHIMDHLIMVNADQEKKKKFATSELRAARDQILAAMARCRMDDLKKELHYQPNPAVQQELVMLMDAAGYGKNVFTAEECAALVLKFIWQVRRKMFAIPVTNHLMLVFTGSQGSGKSILVSKMCQPLIEVTKATSLAAITDDRNIELFRRFIGTLEELEHADRTSVESLKAVISASMMSRRPMRENSTIDVKQNLTFIGTANKDVAELIIDETGNRRLIQINVIDTKHPKSAEFWQRVNDMDWLALWRSVDENAADPTQDILSRIRSVQSAQRSLSSIEMWIEHISANVNHEDHRMSNAEFVSVVQLYRSFRQWEECYGSKFQTSIQMFSKSFLRLSRQDMVPFAFTKKNNTRGYMSGEYREKKWDENDPQ